jgi:hypothetical protein
VDNSIGKLGKGLRKTTEREDRAIVIYVKRYRLSSVKDIQRALDLPPLSLTMIYTRIKESGEFESYWTARKPYISKQNRIKRVK